MSYIEEEAKRLYEEYSAYYGIPTPWDRIAGGAKSGWRNTARKQASSNASNKVLSDRLNTCSITKWPESCKKEESTMSITITKPTFINGNEAGTVSTDALLSLICAAKKRATELEEMGIESKTVTAMIAKENAGIASAIAELDSPARKVK